MLGTLFKKTNPGIQSSQIRRPDVEPQGKSGYWSLPQKPEVVAILGIELSNLRLCVCAIGFCICDTSFQHRHVTSGPSSSVYPCPFFCGFLKIVAKQMWFRIATIMGHIWGYPPNSSCSYMSLSKEWLFWGYPVPSRSKPEGLPETSQLGVWNRRCHTRVSTPAAHLQTKREGL